MVKKPTAREPMAAGERDAAIWDGAVALTTNRGTKLTIPTSEIQELRLIEADN